MTQEILKGIRVLSQTEYQLGTVAGTMLAQMGAEVIKIEPPRGDTGRTLMGAMTGGEGKGRFGENLSPYFENNNRGVKSLVVDMNKPKAKEVFYQLVAKSDVYITNLRWGVPQKLGLGYDVLKKYNPKLIYCAGTSFGSEGPDARKPGFDASGAARSGSMMMVPEGEDPVTHLGGIYDQIGAIFISHAITAALLARERYGIGQFIETSHLTASMWLQGLTIQILYYSGFQMPVRHREEGFMPLWVHHKCKDGVWIHFLMLQPDRHWPVLCDALGIDQATRSDPRFKDGKALNANTKDVIALIDSKMITKTSTEWAKIFEGKDIFWEKVQSYKDLPNDVQCIANKYITWYNHPLTGVTYPYVNIPMQFHETPAFKQGRAPMLGEHTGEVLTNILGYKPEDVPELIKEIGEPTGWTGGTTM